MSSRRKRKDVKFLTVKDGPVPMSLKWMMADGEEQRGSDYPGHI